jgi:hypothetical protein
MQAKRLTMRKIRGVLRLAFSYQLSERQIATSCLIAQSIVSKYLGLFAAAGLSEPLSP